MNEWSGLCLDLENDADGTRLKQFPCHGFENQQFNLELVESSQFLLRAQSSQKCVDVADFSLDDAARVQQWGCHSDLNQRWAFLE